MNALNEVVLEATSDTKSDLQSDAHLAQTLVLSMSLEVETVKVDNSSNLVITFGDGSRLQFPGISEPIDEVWSIYTPLGVARRRQFAEPAFVQSYSGELTMDPAFAAFGASA